MYLFLFFYLFPVHHVWKTFKRFQVLSCETQKCRVEWNLDKRFQLTVLNSYSYSFIKISCIWIAYSIFLNELNDFQKTCQVSKSTLKRALSILSFIALHSSAFFCQKSDSRLKSQWPIVKWLFDHTNCYCKSAIHTLGKSIE